ncbi:MAG: hypothetical protein Q8L48_36340 [Archangium sp.]|nr:hypothetical protein [Archangium sp.]
MTNPVLPPRTGGALLVVALLSLAASGAEPCAKDGVLLFPAPGAVVPTNVQFIIQGTGEAQAKVQGLLQSNAIALVAAGKDAIPVKAEKGFVSQVSRVAIRLRPLKPLEPNVEYSLALPPELAGVRLLNDQLGDGSLRWLAGVGPDKRSPKYKERPSSSEGFYEQDKAGGLTRKLRLRALIEESSPAWLLVSMQRARGGSARQQFPVALEGDTFTIGHDACSGNFGFDDGRAYTLSIELFDAAGNKAAERTRIEVAAPRPLH